MKQLKLIVAALIAASAIAPLIVGLRVGEARRSAEENEMVELSLELTPLQAYWLEWGLAAAVTSSTFFCILVLLEPESEEKPMLALPPASDVEIAKESVNEIDDFTC